MLAPAFLSYLACCRRTTPVYSGRRTTGKDQGTLRGQTNNVFTHRPNMIIRGLGNNKHLSIIRHTVSTLLRTFPCGRNWNIVIYILVIAYVEEGHTHQKNIQLHLIKTLSTTRPSQLRNESPFLQGCKKEESCGMVFSSNLKFYAASRIRNLRGEEPIWFRVNRLNHSAHRSYKSKGRFGQAGNMVRWRWNCVFYNIKRIRCE